MNHTVTVCSFCALLLIICTTSNASSLDADINNDALRGQFNLSDKNADLGLSLALILTDDEGEVGYFTARTQGTLAGQSNVRGGFGGRAYHGSPEDGDSFQALAIGGYINVTFPQMTDLTASVEAYYAPSITITDDYDNLSEISFRLSYQLFENASAYVGLRYLEAEFDNFDFEFDDGAHIGFNLQF